MENSRFSTLIYRIIGRPDKWHDDYIDLMHQILDETDSFDKPEKFLELKTGNQILNRIRGSDDALTAFNTLLNESRLRMIILDEDVMPIYHNQSASGLFLEVLDPNAQNNEQRLKPSLKKSVQEAIAQVSEKNLSNLIALKAFDSVDDQLYLRIINNRNGGSTDESLFYLLLALDQGSQQGILNPEFVQQYELTEKEQNVLLKLIHGRNVKETATELFVSDNTVKTHLKSLFRKTDSKSQADVIRLALTHQSQVLDSYFDPTSGGLANIVSEKTPDKFVTLKDGFKIAYREYGPPQGNPIVVCHNGYGCRLMVPNHLFPVLSKHNKRLIIPDRPGTGLTVFRKGHPHSWNDSFNEFIDLLELGNYEVIGSVMGSAFAIIHAASAGEQLKRLHLASPVFVNTRSDMDFLTGIFAPGTRLIRASKRFTQELYELWLKSITMSLSTHYRSILEKNLGSEERKKLQKDRVLNKTLEHMVNCFKEGASRTLTGISSDMMFCVTPRKVDLGKISIPVEIWWGTEDSRISREGVQNLSAQLKNSNVNIREGFSEHIYYSLFEEIIAKSVPKPKAGK